MRIRWRSAEKARRAGCVGLLRAHLRRLSGASQIGGSICSGDSPAHRRDLAAAGPHPHWVLRLPAGGCPIAPVLRSPTSTPGLGSTRDNRDLRAREWRRSSRSPSAHVADGDPTRRVPPHRHSGPAHAGTDDGRDPFVLERPEKGQSVDSRARSPGRPRGDASAGAGSRCSRWRHALGGGGLAPCRARFDPSVEPIRRPEATRDRPEGSCPGWRPDVDAEADTEAETDRAASAAGHAQDASRAPAGGDGGHLWPLPVGRTITNRFSAAHPAIDIAAPLGTSVRAIAAGTVIDAGWRSNGGGNVVVIRHPDGMVSTYNHNRDVAVRRGQLVEAGQQMATGRRHGARDGSPSRSPDRDGRQPGEPTRRVLSPEPGSPSHLGSLLRRTSAATSPPHTGCPA